MVLHAAREAESGRAAHPGGAVQQRSALLHVHAVDVICHRVKKVVEVRGGSIYHRHVYALDVFEERVGHLCRHVDDCRDVVGRQHEFIVGCHPIADV